MSECPSKPSRLARMVRKGARWLERALAVVGLVMIVYHAAFDISVVTSESMAPTLLGRNVESGDWVLTEKVSYWFRDPHRWEVVRLRTEKGDSIVKRVVGLPGEEMSVRDKIPVIDGQPTPPPRRLAFLKYWALGNLFQGASVPCGDGFYVMGDDSRDSQDSRFEGPVKREEIQGRIMFIVWPLYRFGPVSPNT